MHALHVWAISSNEFALSAHLGVADEPISELTTVVRRVKAMLMERFAIGHPTLEVEYGRRVCRGHLCSRGRGRHDDGPGQPFAAGENDRGGGALARGRG